MFEIFLNPANMVIGGALISSPILIHLINRMRFKRIRWAAMEFLLKSQKRNRRRLIIEQMILLFLRILLVLLAGLLLARFIGNALALVGPRNSVHLVLLDDRLSMTDAWKNDKGEKKTCFDVGKQLIEQEIAKKAVQRRSAQQLVLRRLSDPGREYFDRRLNEESLKELSRAVDQMEGCTQAHLDLARGVAAAQEVFSKYKQDERFLYVVSDFRQNHWSESEASALNKTLNALAGSGVEIKLVDTADPERKDSQKVPLYHDNMAVLELRPETRVAAEEMPVQFSVKVANFSPSDKKGVQVTVKVDGSVRFEGSLTIMNVPAGKIEEKTFQVAFTRPPTLPPGAPYFAHITANLEDEAVGLQADNVRHAVVEVRRQVPVLLVDGDLSNGLSPGGDTFHLKSLFTSARGFSVTSRGVAELELPNLDQYPSIYLLNVRELSDKALKNLEAYVRDGGSVAFFLGERVNPDFYNKKLYAQGTGLFPAPLADRPSPELSAEEEQQKHDQILQGAQNQLYLRKVSEKHPIFKDVYPFRDLFQFLTVRRYYPVPRLKWNPKARQQNHVEELATLPNERPVSDYEGTAKGILDSLPVAESKYAKYRPALERHVKTVREAAGGKSVHVLANALAALLEDKGQPNDPQQPNLVEFWEKGDAAVKDLRARIDQFREAVVLGDPLVVSGRYGKGRTVVFLTTAGQKWNNWGGEFPVSTSYPVVMIELQKYLTSMEDEADLSVGDRLRLEVDSTRYENTMRRFLQLDAKAEPRGEQTVAETQGKLAFEFDGAHEPGVYLLELTQRPEPGAEPKKEVRAYAFNVDAQAESDLKRIGKAELEKASAGHVVGGPSGDPIVVAKSQADLSESPWLYLGILAVLVVEQALAVHLSFHLRGSEALLPGQAVRPQATAAA